MNRAQQILEAVERANRIPSFYRVVPELPSPQPHIETEVIPPKEGMWSKVKSAFDRYIPDQRQKYHDINPPSKPVIRVMTPDDAVHGNWDSENAVSARRHAERTARRRL